MDAIEPNLRALAVFAAAWAVCCAGAILLAGLLPLAEAPNGVRSRGGTLLILADFALLVAAAALALLFCFHELRWTSIVISGGAIFLFSPFATQDLPDAFKHGTVGLAVLLLLLLASLGLLLNAGAGRLLPIPFSNT